MRRLLGFRQIAGHGTGDDDFVARGLHEFSPGRFGWNTFRGSGLIRYHCPHMPQQNTAIT